MTSLTTLTRTARIGGSTGQRKSRRSKGLTYGALIGAALVTIFPFYVMVLLSFKNSTGIVFPKSIIPNPSSLTMSNYQQILGHTSRVVHWFLNSTIYAGVGVVLILVFSSMAGYAFAKKQFKGRNAIFWTCMAMLMVPSQVMLIPLFILVSKLGGVNTYWGLIAPCLATTQGVFLMRQFISQLPDDLFEAAKLDGASEWRMYRSLVLPLIKPALATLAVFVFLWNWNDFLWPLVIGQHENMRTLTVGLASLQAEQTPPNVMMASATVSFLPTFIVFLLLQRHYVRGIATTGSKG